MQARFPTWKLAAFIILSVCDFITTFLLLSYTDGAVYESNPVANSWLEQSGWVGLAVFKVLIVFGVAGIAVYMFQRRPRVAHDLLAIGCGAVIVAVVTGAGIAISHAGPPIDDSQVHIDSPDSPAEWEDRYMEYQMALDNAAAGLDLNEIDVPEAVSLLKETSLGNDEEWIKSLTFAYPGLENGSALLAAEAIQHTVTLQLRTPRAADLAQRLEGQLRQHYGVTHEFPYQRLLHLKVPRSTSQGSSN